MRLKDKVAVVSGAASGMGAAANLFLAADKTSYISGIEIPVDGGFLSM